MSAGLVIEDLHVAYGRTVVVPGLSARLPRGAVVGLIGPNGCGKSTTIRALAGVQPSHGRVDLDGVSGPALQQSTGYMPQELPGDVALTALESVLVAGRRGRAWRTRRSEIAQAHAALDRLDVAHLADRSLAHCSGGQRQLIALAQSLARDPQLILLDEPTSALDLRHQVTVLAEVRRRVHGSSPDASAEAERGARAALAVVALHDLNLAARFCDQLLLMREGRIVSSGAPEDVLAPTTLREVYGIHARVIRDGEHVMVAAG